MSLGRAAQQLDRIEKMLLWLVITTKIKTKLAAEHINSLGNIKVDTDANGVVYLSGSAHSQAAIDQAVSIARDTEGVKSVKNELTVKADD